MDGLPALHIQLLGDFHLVYGDETIAGVKTNRLQSLLAYLILHRNSPQPRQRLAFLFWPDTPEAQARNNLRNLLHFLRRALPQSDRFLLIDTQTIQWNPHAVFTLDVDLFIFAATNSASSEELRQAVHLYAGDLLPDCYDDWIQPERERLRELFISKVEQLIQSLENERLYSQAISYARRLLDVEPVREETHLRLMRLYAANGERTQALHTYHACVTLLERELGAEPGPDIQYAYQRLLNVGEQPAIERITGTPALIGRIREWMILQSAWRDSLHGQFRMALVTGEAGIGKSRLADEMIDWAARQEIPTVRTFCFATEQRLAFAPVAGLLRSRPLPALEKFWLSEVARLVPEVLVEHSELSPPRPLTENWQRLHLFKAISLALLKGRPELLFLIEDLQWCDRDSIEWLAYLVHAHAEIAPNSRLFVIGTLRAEESIDNPPLESLLADLRHVEKITEIELQPLNENETIALSEAVIGTALNPLWTTRLYRETEGNPLMIVEMARLLQGKGVEEGQKVIALLSRAQGVITTRLKELTPNAYELAETAAVIGRQFTFPVLLQATGRDEARLVNGLEELWRRRIVREQGQESYDFSHEKIREMIYLSMSAARRKLLHHKVAKALEAVFVNKLEVNSGQIATQYEQAGEIDSAIHWYRQAAEASQRIYANQTAIDFYRRALALLEADHADRGIVPQSSSLIYEVHERIGDLLALTRQLDEADAAYQSALTLITFDKPLSRGRLLRKIGRITSDLEEANRIFTICEEILGTQNDPADHEWWSEWIELQTDRIENYHRRGYLKEILEVISRLQPVVESKGTPLQRFNYFISIALKDDLNDVMEVADPSVSNLRSAKLAATTSGNLTNIARARFHLGTFQTFRDEYEDAERELQEALALTIQTGDLFLKARCLCSLTFLFRRRGLVEDVRQYVSLALSASQAARSAYHIAISQANAAWVAWRDGKLEDAKQYGVTAMSEPVFAAEQMIWAALWPIVGVCIAQNRMDEAIHYARRLFACKY